MRGTIVAVDPDADTCAYYRDVFALADYVVVDAPDPESAFSLIQARRPELVISGLRLPMPRAIALYRNIRQYAGTRSIPILVVTTEMRMALWQRAREAGVDLLLLKPVSPEELLQAGASLLRTMPTALD